MWHVTMPVRCGGQTGIGLLLLLLSARGMGKQHQALQAGNNGPSRACLIFNRCLRQAA